MVLTIGFFYSLFLLTIFFFLSKKETKTSAFVGRQACLCRQTGLPLSAFRFAMKEFLKNNHFYQTFFFCFFFSLWKCGKGWGELPCRLEKDLLPVLVPIPPTNGYKGPDRISDCTF